MQKKSVAPLVCGIIGVALCWIPIVAIILGIIATATGVSQRKNLLQEDTKMATIGMILGIIALVLGIVFIIYNSVVAAQAINGIINSYY